MKKLLSILTFGCFLPFFTNGQTGVQGIALSPSFVNIGSKPQVYCFTGFPPPLATDCNVKTSNTFGLKLNYWRRWEDAKRPLFAAGSMGLFFMPSELREIEFTTEADVPNVILAREESQQSYQSLYLHFAMAGGYRFQVRQMPVRVYTGVFTDLPLWGKRKYDAFSVDFYNYSLVEDPACQCRVVAKTPLGEPEYLPGYKWEKVGLDDAFIDHLAGVLLGFEVDVPLKSRQRFSAGYRYERVLSNPDFDAYKLVGIHNLNLSIGFAKSGEIGSGQPEPKNKGFVLGTQANLLLYDDGDTKNLLGFDLAFGYNTKKGIRPELRLSRFSQWSGKDASGAAASGGVAFSTADGYIVPRIGLTYAVWSEWASELNNNSTGIYGGAGLQYPNTGWLRMEFSVLARLWLGRSGNTAYPSLTFGYGVYYFFGKN